MSKNPKKQTSRVFDPKKGKDEGLLSKFGKLFFVALLCASAWLFCIYLFPLPDSTDEASPKGDFLETKDRFKSQASMPVLTATLILPKQSTYAGSEKEKKQLLSDVETAVASYPNNPSILHIAGLTYAELQQSERAIALLRKSIQLESSKAEVVTALADLLLQVGKPEDAIVVLEQAIDRVGETEPLLSALGESYSQAGQLEKAVQTLERAVAKLSASTEKQSSSAGLRLAQALTQVGRFEEAEKHARESLLQRPSDLPSFVALSNALMRQNKREEAMEVRSRMPKVEPSTMADDQKYELSFRGFASHNYAMLGGTYAAQNNLDSAEKFFIRSLEIEPDSSKTALHLADMLRRNGRTQDAMIVYKKLIEIQPDNVLHYHNLASLAVSVGDLQTAERVLRSATTVDASGAADMQLAQFLLAIGDVSHVVKHAQLATEKLGTVDAHLVLMDACKASGDNAAAFNAYLKAKKIAPNDPRLANFTP